MDIGVGLYDVKNFEDDPEGADKFESDIGN